MTNSLKIVVFIIFILPIWSHGKYWPYQTCNVDLAKLAVPPVVWFEQTIDGPAQPSYFTRFIHNKANIFISNTAKCYFENTDPYVILKTTGTFGILFYFYLFYIMIEWKKILIFSALMAVPILPFLKFPTNYQIIIYQVISSVGLLLFLFKGKMVGK